MFVACDALAARLDKDGLAAGTWNNNPTGTNWSTVNFNTYFKEGDDVAFKAGSGTVAVTGTVKPKEMTLETEPID